MEQAYHYVDTPIGAQHSKMAREGREAQEVQQPPQQQPAQQQAPRQQMMMRMPRYQRSQRQGERTGLMIVMMLATAGLIYGVYCMTKKRNNTI